jgi:predicted MFS family arabinose efflux permease
MGLLNASGTAAFIVLGLLAGVIADRFPRRAVLVVVNLLSVVAIATIPAAAALGALRMELLYAVEFVTGCCGVVGEVAFQSFLPRLVGRDRLLAGNALIRSIGSVTEIVGPSAAGVIIQILTAPVAIIFDAVGWAVSAVLTFLIRVDEPPAPARAPGHRIWHDVLEGLRFVLGDPALRAIAAGGATHNFFSNGALVALYILYANQVLGLGPIELGIAFSFGGPGALVGSILALRYARWFGMRSTLVHMQLLTGLSRSLIPLAIFVPQPIVLVAAGELLLGIVRAILNVNVVSLRQAMTPDHLQGRMSASIRFLMWSVVPFGALLGGLGGERIGLQATMTIAAFGTTLAAAAFMFVPTGEAQTV